MLLPFANNLVYVLTTRWVIIGRWSVVKVLFWFLTRLLFLGALLLLVVRIALGCPTRTIASMLITINILLHDTNCLLHGWAALAVSSSWIPWRPRSIISGWPHLWLLLCISIIESVVILLIGVSVVACCSLFDFACGKLLKVGDAWLESLHTLFLANELTASLIVNVHRGWITLATGLAGLAACLGHTDISWRLMSRKAGITLERWLAVAAGCPSSAAVVAIFFSSHGLNGFLFW